MAMQYDVKQGHLNQSGFLFLAEIVLRAFRSLAADTTLGPSTQPRIQTTDNDQCKSDDIFLSASHQCGCSSRHK